MIRILQLLGFVFALGIGFAAGYWHRGREKRGMLKHRYDGGAE